MTRHHSCRVSPFGHPRINARLTAPRGITQPPTSFIGSQCQGIHHAPLNTYNTNTKKFSEESEIAYQMQKPHNPITRTKPHDHCIRCSQPLSTNQTPHPTTKAEQQHANPTAGAATPTRESQPPPVSHTRDEEVTGLLSQSPIVCLAIHHRKIQPKLNPVAAQRLLCTKPGATTAHGFLTAHTPTNWGCLSWCSLERR